MQITIKSGASVLRIATSSRFSFFIFSESIELHSKTLSFFRFEMSIIRSLPEQPLPFSSKSNTLTLSHDRWIVRSHPIKFSLNVTPDSLPSSSESNKSIPTQKSSIVATELSVFVKTVDRGTKEWKKHRKNVNRKVK